MVPALSIVLPCYNEAENLPGVLARFREVLGERGDVEVMLVDNGSRDDTPRVLACELARPENRFAATVLVPVNQGYGHGILAGLRAARGEYLAWTHADMQTDPGDVLVGFEKLRRHPAPRACVLRGRRRGRRPLDAFFTFGMSVAASAALGIPLRDVNAQPKMFHRSLLEKMEDAPRDFSLDLYLLVLAAKEGWDVLEQPVRFGKRRAGEAKGGGTLRGKWKLIRRTWAYILETRRRENQVRRLARCKRAA